MNTQAAYSRAQRLLELAAIACFALLSIACVWRLAATVPAHWLPVLLAMAVPLGWLASDLFSGLLHWAFDTLGSVHTPVIGPAFIRPFREHHVDPRAMTRHDFIETHGASCLAALPVLGIAIALRLESFASALLSAWLLAVALGALATNQCHKWAHMAAGDTPRAVRWLQRHGCILPRAHHQRHHTPPFDSHYCMSCGWLNRPLNALLRAWR